jgi:GT2 family glycosyltransferase
VTEHEPRVAVVLVNYRGWADTIECLASVLAQRHRRLQVFVVDNASGNGSVERIAAWCDRPEPAPHWRTLPQVLRWTLAEQGVIAHREVDPLATPHAGLTADHGPGPASAAVIIVRSPNNGGFAAGCNQGVMVAGVGNFDYFWFLNNDAVVTADALTALLARAGREPDIGITGSTIRYYDRPEFVQALGGASFDARAVSARHLGQGSRYDTAKIDAAQIEASLDYVAGASMLVASRFIREIGPMREDYFLFFEEVDWAMRNQARFRLAYAPESVVFHKAGATTAEALEFSTRFYYRNRVRFASRYLHERLGVVRRELAWELLRHLLRGRWLHAKIVAAVLADFGRLSRDVSEEKPVVRLGV